MENLISVFTIILVFSLATICFAEVINIPIDYATIQQGIDGSSDGDTVLVQPGTYEETINYNGKNIVVASLFWTTEDSSYVFNTEIDGSFDGSVVKFENGEDSTAVLCGFTIKHGHAVRGGGIYCHDSHPRCKNLRIIGNFASLYGAGISATNSDLKLQDILISDNSINSYELSCGGGGAYFINANPLLEDIVCKNNSISSNSLSFGGGLYLANSSANLSNIEIANNTAESDVEVYGAGIYASGSQMTVSDIMLSGNELSAEYEYGGAIWARASEITMNEGVVDNNSARRGSGIFYEENSSFILTNISFTGNSTEAIYCKNNSTLFVDQSVIQNNGRGIVCLDNSSSEVTNVSILGNFTTSMPGGGIYCYNNSAMTLENVLISGNSSPQGGGISCNYSDMTLIDVTITENNTSGDGGGIFCEDQISTNLTNVTISHNNAGNHGGGICWSGVVNPSFNSENRCNIFSNTAGLGYDFYSDADVLLEVVVDTFTILTPNDYFAYPIEKFDFDILNGVIEQVNQDLYVSPQGSNENSGLTPDEPLLNINFALAKAIGDSLNPITIYLDEGIYSPSETEEIFPMSCKSYVSLNGMGEDATILDAEESGRIFHCQNVASVSIQQMTIQHGESDKGSGICSINSSLSISDMVITDNEVISNGNGGGIYIDDTEFVMQNVLVQSNYGGNGGGINLSGNSDVDMYNVTITENTSHKGGGIYGINPAILQSENVIVSQNEASYVGGGICGNINLSNITVYGNSAYAGGGIGQPYSVNAMFSNMDIYANTAQYGSGIGFSGGSPTLYNVNITENTATSEGGGMRIEGECNLTLIETILQDNNAPMGGGIYVENSSVLLNQSTIAENTAFSYGGGFYLAGNSNLNFNSANRSNIYLNTAFLGTDLYSETSFADVVVDTFTVFQPDDYFTYPIEHFDFDIQNAKIEQADTDVYVSPDGSNQNSGLSPDDPLRTLQFALLKVVSDSISPNTIHLANGIYSPSETQEEFPIFTKSHVNVQGEEAAQTILDAEETNQLFLIISVDGLVLSDLTLTNGNAENGGAIYCENSNPELENLIIKNNTAEKGGGIYFKNSQNPQLTGVTVSENSANTAGGIYCAQNSYPILSGSTIKYNSALNNGGGFYCKETTNLNFDADVRSNVYLNSAGNYGDDICLDYDIEQCDVIVDTFTIIQPGHRLVYPIENFTFDILHGKIEQVNQDLYVSVHGSDENSGLTPDDPLKTIYFALTKIIADSSNPCTIYLENGVYSPSTNGEAFPIFAESYVSFCGENERETILEAKNASYGVWLDEVTGVSIKNLAILNSEIDIYEVYAGIMSFYSSFALDNLIITQNQTGIIANDSKFTITNSTICRNRTDYSGLGIKVSGNYDWAWSDTTKIHNCTISQNINNDNEWPSWEGGIVADIGANIEVDHTNICYNNLGVCIGGGCIVSEVTAPNTWWGHETGPDYYDHNDGLGDIIHDNGFEVDFQPFLTLPAADAPPIPPVEFEAYQIGDTFVKLKWKNIPLPDLAGYTVYMDSDSTSYTFETSFDVGTDTTFTITDLDTVTTYYFAVTCSDDSGEESWYSSQLKVTTKAPSGIEDQFTIETPKKPELFQNFPNPFNPTTTIQFSLPQKTHVTLNIYDVSGRLVETLLEEERDAGYHSVTWNADRQPSGVYFYRIVTDSGFNEVRKCVMLK